MLMFRIPPGSFDTCNALNSKSQVVIKHPTPNPQGGAGEDHDHDPGGEGGPGDPGAYIYIERERERDLYRFVLIYIDLYTSTWTYIDPPHAVRQIKWTH